MSELRSVVEAYRSEVLSELPDAQVEEDFTELWRARELLETECLRRLPDLERRGIFERDGHLSAASWLASRFTLAWGAARELARMARGLREMPGTRAALADGKLSTSAAKVLVATREADPAAFGEAEPMLVEAALIHTMGDLRKVTDYWRQVVERQRGLEGDEGLRAQRRLHLSVTFLNTVKLDGLCDPETGETILTAVNAVLDAEARNRDPDDHRTPAQRRLDAMTEICRQFLDRTDRPSVAGERPHVSLTVGVEVLRGSLVLAAPDADTRGAEPDATGKTALPAGLTSPDPARYADVFAGIDPDRMCELDQTGPVSPAVARRISCDASVMRIVLAGRSEPLDVGRRTPVIPPSMRRAVVLRDRHCRFPGCYRPAVWCDAHHIVHWADGGPTAVANLLLLCRRHHRMIHDGRFRLTLEDGRPMFRRPDGSVLEENRAPP